MRVGMGAKSCLSSELCLSWRQAARKALSIVSEGLQRPKRHTAISNPESFFNLQKRETARCCASSEGQKGERGKPQIGFQIRRWPQTRRVNTLRAECRANAEKHAGSGRACTKEAARDNLW